ncbi:hypothetical protein [Haliea sp.]
MPNLLTPPGRTEPVPENLADLLIAHDHGIITANLLGLSRHLLPRARLQRNWSLQERLRGAGFCLLRLPGVLPGPGHSSTEEDLVYVALDLRDRNTLQENLIRLAREFDQSQVILCRRGLPLREIQLAEGPPVAIEQPGRPHLLATQQLVYNGTLLACHDAPEWLPCPGNWISRLACAVIARKDWRGLTV